MASRLSANLRDVISAAMQAQTFVTLVELTPNLDMKAALDDPDVTKTLQTILEEKTGGGDVEAAVRAAKDRMGTVNTHLAAARTEALTWRRDLLPTMFEIDRDVSAFGSEISNVTEKVRTKLTGITAFTPLADLEEAVRQTGLLVAGLMPAVEARRTSIAKLEVDLKQLSANLNETSTAFEADQQAIDALLSSESGVISTLQRQIEGLNGAITRDIVLISVGSVGTIVGIGLIVGGILVATGTLGSGGVLAAALIVGGVVVLAGSVIDLGLSGKNLADTRDQLATAMKDLALLHQLVLFFTAARAHVTSLAGSLEAAADGIGQLRGFWDSEQTDLDELTTALDVARDSAQTGDLDMLKTQRILNDVLGKLATAQLEWAEAKADADFLNDALEGVQTNVDTGLVPEPTPA